MNKGQVKELQRDLNKFFKRFDLGYEPLKVDGIKLTHGRGQTNRYVRAAKFYLGYKGDPSSVVNKQFRWRLEHPRAQHKKFKVSEWDVKRGTERRRDRREYLEERDDDDMWGGCRQVTNKIIRIVNGRYSVTSRKRSETYGNPDSDHHTSQENADAVDFATSNNYALGREIAAGLGARGEWSGDYDNFYVTMDGKRFRVQIIAGTHGTGPHLHAGVRRA